MKHTKIFLALLTLTVTVLAFSCKQPASGFVMNENQKTVYNSMIMTFVSQTSYMDMASESVKTRLEGFNNGFAKLSFKVTDTMAGNPIKKGTAKDELEKRFVPSAI